MNKFYLNCTVQYADPNDNLTMLYSKDLANITLEKVENLYKEFECVESLGDEFEPKTRQIKYAISIFATDVDKDFTSYYSNYEHLP